MNGSSWAQVEHQPRERAVTCRRCFKRDTWNTNAVCDDCTYSCGYCRDERTVERRNYGRHAVEQTTLIRCPRCRDGRPVALAS